VQVQLVIYEKVPHRVMVMDSEFVTGWFFSSSLNFLSTAGKVELRVEIRSNQHRFKASGL
jgi:hypothetical protein